MSRTPPKHRARELIWQVPPGEGEAIRNKLRQKAQELVGAEPRYLRALAMVNLDGGRLLVYVLVCGEKRALSWFHGCFGALLSSDPTHELWTEPEHGGKDSRIEASLQKFRDHWRNVPGAHCEEIPGQGGQHGPIIEEMDFDINEALELLTEIMPEDELAELSEAGWQAVIDSLDIPALAYRSLGGADEGVRQARAALFARVRSKLRAHFGVADPVAAAPDGL